MLFDYVSLAGGLVVLIIAGDILVRGSVGIAQRLGIPNLVIGLTIVAFGTSAPAEKQKHQADPVLSRCLAGCSLSQQEDRQIQPLRHVCRL